MSVRVRAILVIVVTNLVIILFSVFAGIGFSRRNIEKSIETDMTVVANIADHFISSEMEVLRLKAVRAAEIMASATEAEWAAILISRMNLYPDFVGYTVFDRERGLVISSGEQSAPQELMNDKYIERAFAGETVFTSTYPTKDGVMFCLALPVPRFSGRVLAITIPGMYFSNRLSSFVIWETGHIFIDDSEGNVIANIREEWVEGRFNFIRLSETDESYKGIAAVVKRMINGESGIGRFSISGVPRICAFRPIDGSNEGWCLGVVAPLPESPAGNINRGLLVVGLVCFILNVIAAIIASNFIKKPFEEVVALKEEAEAQSRSKSGFLANMSHEMRTPLNAVIGFSQLALDRKIEGEEKENIEKVYSAGVTLLGIINDILDISKIESGKFELHPLEYDVPSLINDSVSLNIMRIGEKPIAFKLFVDETIPAKLYGDDLRIKQIFNNLLSNAFKYTKAGTVEWNIGWEKKSDGVWLISSVKDSGIGIKPEDLDKLFLNYSRVDMKSNRQMEGTGLGLALARRMVELMDGSISVESEYGKGSIFSFRIKQGFVTDAPIGRHIARSLKDFRYNNHKQERHSTLIRLRIPYAKVLVVDDLLPNLAVVNGIMKPYDMQVDCVTSGEEAVQRIRNGVKYNAIFMDHMMPGMNGIEAVKIIRNEIDSEYARTVPIIALTANAIRGSEEMFLESGFQAFLSKPIEIIQMDAVIRQWVRDKEQEKNLLTVEEGQVSGGNGGGIDTQTESGKASGVKKTGKIDGIDLEKILEQFGGDEEALSEILKYYADMMPSSLDKIRSVVPEKLPDYVIAVHGIKGASRNMYAEKAGTMAEALEKAGKAGDLNFIKENNEALIRTIEELIAAIKKWLDQ